MCCEGPVGQEEPFVGYCHWCPGLGYFYAMHPYVGMPHGPHKTPEHLEYHLAVKHPESMAVNSTPEYLQALAKKLGL